MSDAVLYEKDSAAHVATITFNRPDKLNALTLAMYHEMGDYIADADQDDDIKVIVFRANGSSFSTGQDLSEVGFMYGFGDGSAEKPQRPSQRRRLSTDRDWSNRLAAVTYSTKITVAEVQGHCLGSGFDIMLACDVSVVADDANLGHPGRRLVGPGNGFNSVQWFWKLGPALAKYMMVTGDTISGQHAYERGVTTHCVPADKLRETTEELVSRIAKVPADGIAMGKVTFRMVADVNGIGMGYDFGYLMHSFGTNIRFEDDEHNFFRARREKGHRDAYHERDGNFQPSQA